MKPSIKDWKEFGLEVTVCGPDGRALPEYDHPESDAKSHKYFKYLEVVPGERFSVHIRRSYWFWAKHYSFTLYADGYHTSQVAFPRRPRLHAYSFEGYNCRNGNDLAWHNYHFGEMDVTEGELPSNISMWPSVGTINLVMKTGHLELIEPKIVSMPPETPAFKGYAKAGLYTYISGKVGGKHHVGSLFRFTPKRTEPTIVFCFVYRTTEALQELGVIPTVRNVKSSSEKEGNKSVTSASAVSLNEKETPLIQTVS